MSRTLRWIVPAVVVLIWLAIGGTGGPFFGKLSEVQSQSAEDFLPATAESTRVRELQRQAADQTGIPAVILFVDENGIEAEQQSALQALVEPVGELAGVSGVSPLVPPRQGISGAPEALVAFANVSSDADPEAVVSAIRETIGPVPDGVSAYVTGPAGFAADLTEAFSGIDGILLIVAVAAVLVILLAVYRSPILPFLVIFTAVSGLGASVVLVYLMASADWIVLNGQAQGILFILVVGAATDYSLLLVARYRDALHNEDSHIRALGKAWRGVLEPIAASAGTVIAGLLVLLLSDLNSNQALGPVATVGIVCALLSAMTLLPALLALIGRRAFFPAIPRADHRAVPGGRLWGWVADRIETRHRALWIVTTIVLVGLAAMAPHINATGVSQSEIFIGETESVDGQDLLADYYPAGSGTPVVVIAPSETAEDTMSAIEGDEAVDSASTAGTPFQADGREWTEINATLSFSADSEEAIDAVKRIRNAVAEIDEAILVGGATATTLDTRTTATRDLWTIIPIVLAVILAILVLLLRSLVAPVLLIASTAVSYLAALGISGLVFEYVFGFPGADPAVPLFAFVFLVALGIDYNIFLTTRVREEAAKRGTRAGILEGLRATGGVITSAGVVLAATFAALAVIPILFLVQIAFIVALGVLLDTIVVRSILVPGVFYDIGSRVWAPSKLARDRD